MLHTALPLYRDTYQLILKVFEYTKDFSKEYKYTLGQDMKRDALQLMRSIYPVNKHKNRVEHFRYERVGFLIHTMHSPYLNYPTKKALFFSMPMPAAGKKTQ